MLYAYAYVAHLSHVITLKYKEYQSKHFETKQWNQNLNEILRLKHHYIKDEITLASLSILEQWMLTLVLWFKDKYTTFSLMTPGQKFIVVLTFAFMIVCGMTTGGFILEQIGDGEMWQKVMGFAGAIASGNAQKSIFLAPLQDLVLMFGMITQGEGLEGLLLITLTFISAACTFMINYGLGSFGAEIFMIAILGMSGPPGWVALCFALFFALMNALLVLSGTLSDIKGRDKTKNIFQIITSSFMKRWILSLFAIVIALGGLLMTFYSGADEVAQKFGGIVVAGLLLVFALWTEGCYAYRKMMDAFTTKHMPEWTFGAVFDKLCIILNAITVGFIAAEGGERFAENCGLGESSTPTDGTTPSEPESQSSAEVAATECIKVVAGVVGSAVSYAYTAESADEQKDQTTKSTLINQYKSTYLKKMPTENIISSGHTSTYTYA